MTMLRVGLTGSIGVGKSFVAGVLEELGCHVVDADQTAREVVMPGTPGLATVVETFGSKVLRDDGTLDRQKLGAIVFSDQSKRELLNSILHPYIIVRQDELLREWERADPAGIGVVDAALMIESGGYKRFDKLIVVHCRPEVQLERLIKRDGISEEEARQRVSAQLSQEEKCKLADYLIDTSEGFAATRTQTEKVFRELQELSRRQVVKSSK
ncbi:MAG TPA: dephospho-CoA kinase [Pyrinomonadaceae bacterium]|nr:dephospho-CoA kinase [Pyrinomonadaceae bacterium]